MSSQWVIFIGLWTEVSIVLAEINLNWMEYILRENNHFKVDTQWGSEEHRELGPRTVCITSHTNLRLWKLFFNSWSSQPHTNSQLMLRDGGNVYIYSFELERPSAIQIGSDLKCFNNLVLAIVFPLVNRLWTIYSTSLERTADNGCVHCVSVCIFYSGGCSRGSWSLVHDGLSYWKTRQIAAEGAYKFVVFVIPVCYILSTNSVEATSSSNMN